MERKMEKKVDWIIHYVFGETDRKGHVNIHTHGMEKYGHLNFQIVLPIEQGLAKNLLNNICSRVQNGEKFTDGIYDDLLMNGYKVKLKTVDFRDEKLIRYILPDSKNRFPEDTGCEEPYCYQEDIEFSN